MLKLSMGRKGYGTGSSFVRYSPQKNSRGIYFLDIFQINHFQRNQESICDEKQLLAK
jgi:hypothetical protein